MGFGLLLAGYISVLGFLPDMFVYYDYLIYIAVAGGLVMLAGFVRLREYNIYFRIMKYICIVYILILLGFTPFLVIKHSDVFMQDFMFISKIIRIFLLFIFHYFMLWGILSLAKSIDNTKVIKGAKRNIYLTYIYFPASLLGLFNISDAYYYIPIFLGLIYFGMMIIVLFSCYSRITYEGHDEEIEEKLKKIDEKSGRRNTGKKR